jgi:Domain of unknown function (DUF4878)
VGKACWKGKQKEMTKLLTLRLVLLLSFAIIVVPAASVSIQAQNSARSPSETVLEFYKMMREKKFRDAFALSIYKPVIEALSNEEFNDLRPDFEAMAAAIPDKVDLTGEQISGDAATVFVKVKDSESGGQAEPVSLMRVEGKWIIGDPENQEVVRKAGKNFFYNARIDTHHNEVQNMLQRISLAQVVYGQQHNGQFGDLAALIAAGLLPKDLEATQSTGYRFKIMLSGDKKSWTASAEPEQYGRTGKLSFFMDQTGVKSGDVGGKPLTAAPAKP